MALTNGQNQSGNECLGKAMQDVWAQQPIGRGSVEDYLAHVLEHLDLAEVRELVRAWPKLDRDYTLGDVVTMKTATKAGAAKGSDVYLWRVSGTPAYCGRPQLEWHQNTIGLKVKKQYVKTIPVRWLFLYLAWIWKRGVMRLYSHGTVQQMIRQSDLRRITLPRRFPRHPPELARWYR